MHQNTANAGTGCSLQPNGVCSQHFASTMRLLSVPTRSSTLKSRTSPPQDWTKEGEGIRVPREDHLNYPNVIEPETANDYFGLPNGFRLGEDRHPKTFESYNGRTSSRDEAHKSLVLRNATPRKWYGRATGFWQSLICK